MSDTIDKTTNQNEVKETSSTAPNTGSKAPEFKDATQTKTSDYSDNFNQEFNNLSKGEAPSTKTLKQHIINAGDNNDECLALMQKISGGIEYIPLGNKVEFILTNGLTVQTMDETKFIATMSDVVDPSDHTYIDEGQLLPIAHSDLTPQYRVVYHRYTLKEFYISGQNIETVKANIKADGNKNVAMYMFQDFYEWMKNIYDSIIDKEPTTSKENVINNYFVDSEKNVIDAFANFKTFLAKLTSVSNKFFVGEAKLTITSSIKNPDTPNETKWYTQTLDKTQGHKGFVDFDKCYNKCELSDLTFLTDKATYIQIQKWLSMLKNTGVETLINLNQFMTLPESYLLKKNPNGKSNDIGKIALTKDFFYKNDTYQKGTIYILANEGKMFKIFSNYEHAASQDYVPNHSYIVTFQKNYNMKPLKYGIVGVYQNEAIHSGFSVPVSTDSEDN